MRFGRCHSTHAPNSGGEKVHRRSSLFQQTDSSSIWLVVGLFFCSLVLLGSLSCEATYVDPWSCNDLCSFGARNGICEVSSPLAFSSLYKTLMQPSTELTFTYANQRTADQERLSLTACTALTAQTAVFALHRQDVQRCEEQGDRPLSSTNRNKIPLRPRKNLLYLRCSQLHSPLIGRKTLPLNSLSDQHSVRRLFLLFPCLRRIQQPRSRVAQRISHRHRRPPCPPRLRL